MSTFNERMLAFDRAERRRKNLKLFFYLLVALGAYFLYAFFFGDRAVVVQKFHEAQLHIAFDTTYVQKGAWSLPQGAYNVSKEQKIRSYTKEKTGEKPKKKYGTSTTYPRGKKNLIILSRKTKKVDQGYKKVENGYETYYAMERVKAGTKKVKCGEEDMGNGYFKTKYCKEPIYKEKRVAKRRKKYKEVRKYATVTEYEYSYSAMEPVYKKIPVLDTYYRFDIDTTAVRVQRYESIDNIDEDKVLLRAGKNERIQGRQNLWVLRVHKDYVEREGKYDHRVDSSSWMSYQIGDEIRSGEIDDFPTILYFDKNEL